MPQVGDAGKSSSLLPRTDTRKHFSTWFSSMELSTPQSTEKSVFSNELGSTISCRCHPALTQSCKARAFLSKVKCNIPMATQ